LQNKEWDSVQYLIKDEMISIDLKPKAGPRN
jgi:hypothetical protein